MDTSEIIGVDGNEKDIGKGMKDGRKGDTEDLEEISDLLHHRHLPDMSRLLHLSHLQNMSDLLRRLMDLPDLHLLDLLTVM